MAGGLGSTGDGSSGDGFDTGSSFSSDITGGPFDSGIGASDLYGSLGGYGGSGYDSSDFGFGDGGGLMDSFFGPAGGLAFAGEFGGAAPGSDYSGNLGGQDIGSDGSQGGASQVQTQSFSGGQNPYVPSNALQGGQPLTQQSEASWWGGSPAFPQGPTGPGGTAAGPPSLNLQPPAPNTPGSAQLQPTPVPTQTYTPPGAASGATGSWPGAVGQAVFGPAAAAAPGTGVTPALGGATGSWQGPPTQANVPLPTPRPADAPATPAAPAAEPEEEAPSYRGPSSPEEGAGETSGTAAAAPYPQRQAAPAAAAAPSRAAAAASEAAGDQVTVNGTTYTQGPDGIYRDANGNVVPDTPGQTQQPAAAGAAQAGGQNLSGAFNNILGQFAHQLGLGGVNDLMRMLPAPLRQMLQQFMQMLGQQGGGQQAGTQQPGQGGGQAPFGLTQATGHGVVPRGTELRRGQTINGWTYNGGNPNLQSSWSRAGGDETPGGPANRQPVATGQPGPEWSTAGIGNRLGLPQGAQADVQPGATAGQAGPQWNAGDIASSLGLPLGGATGSWQGPAPVAAPNAAGVPPTPETDRAIRQNAPPTGPGEPAPGEPRAPVVTMPLTRARRRAQQRLSLGGEPAAPAGGGGDEQAPPTFNGTNNASRWLKGQSYLETSLRNARPWAGHSAAGYFQFEPATARDAVRMGIGDPRTGSYDQQAQKTWAYIQRVKPRAAAAIQRGDFQSATRMLRGIWPSLPGGSQAQSRSRYVHWNRLLAPSLEEASVE